MTKELYVTTLHPSSHGAHGRSPAQQAHVRRIGWAMTVYALILVPSAYAVGRHLLTGPLTYVVALVASAPLLAMFASWSRYLAEESDEYLRALAVTRIVQATNVTLAIAVVAGFLQSFGHLPLIALNWVPVIWAVAERLAAQIQLRRI
jgi:hypothetical protein